MTSFQHTDSPHEASEGPESGRTQPQARTAGAGPADTPRTVIRGEIHTHGQQTTRSHAALTDWLNVTFPFHTVDSDPQVFFDRFGAVTLGLFGGMTDRERGLHGWKQSCIFDRGSVVFAFGGQRNSAFLSFSGEGCSFVPDWQPLIVLLRDEFKGHITRWDGAVDDFEGLHSVDYAVELFRQGGFAKVGVQPLPQQFGNWITPDDLGRTFQLGKRKNGKLIRIYEKGKQLGDPTSPWVRWEVEHHPIDRVIPWDVLERPGDYVAGAYPCLSWVSESASRIRTVRKQDDIAYDRLKRVGALAYGALINVMMRREGTAEKVVALLRREGAPKRLAFSEDYLGLQEHDDGL